MFRKRNLKFNQAINESISQSMVKDENIIILGLGADDPLGIFGTTINLKEKFNKERVNDMPTSENSMMGFGIGLSLNKFKPIITHQRVEFSLLSIEQIINQAAKWSYMSDGKSNVPIVIRLIIGKGWGQGPQHSQSLETLFAHIPGLKVVCPSNAYDAKGLMNASIKDPNPVIFFEHRWLHNTLSNVPKKSYTVEIGKSKRIQTGKDVTLVSSSYSVLETIEASRILKNNYDINADVIDLKTLRPLDEKPVINSMKKTKKLVVVDNGWMHYGISSEIISIASEYFSKTNTKVKMDRLGVVDTPIPSTRFLAKYCYPTNELIINKVLKMLNIKKKYQVNKNILTDVPNKNFTGPF